MAGIGCRHCEARFSVGSFDGDSELLLIHYLDLHPLHFHLLRNGDSPPPNTPQQSPEQRKDGSRARSLEPQPSPTRHDHDRSRKRRRSQCHETTPVYSSLQEAREAAAARCGRTPDAKAKLAAAENKVARVKMRLESKSTLVTVQRPTVFRSPSPQSDGGRSPSPPSRRRTLFVPPPSADNFVPPPPRLLCNPKTVRADRCRHNDVPCPTFPACEGRTCPKRHPSCPKLEDDRHCLMDGECPFEHPEYEKACYFCVGRQGPAELAPLLRRCPHRKSFDCMREERTPGNCSYGQVCTFSHGMCSQGSECLSQCCYYEHIQESYFCPNCADYASLFHAMQRV